MRLFRCLASVAFLGLGLFGPVAAPVAGEPTANVDKANRATLLQPGPESKERQTRLKPANTEPLAASASTAPAGESSATDESTDAIDLALRATVLHRPPSLEAEER